MAQIDIPNEANSRAGKRTDGPASPRFFPLPSLGRAAVRGLDHALCRVEGIEEFCRGDDCLFRIRLGRAAEDIHLADGTHLRRGEPVGELHYWNQHVPHLGEGRSALAWALAADRAVRRSLQALAEFAASDPRYRSVQAFGGVMCGLPARGTLSMAVTGRRYGFETRPVGPPRDLGDRLHRWGEDMLIRMLAWAYNPGSLRAAPARCEVWISRQALLSRYGSSSQV